MKKEEILLIGGAGFIGSHIAELYLASGKRVIILDDLSTGNLSNLANVMNHPHLTFYQGSVLDKELLKQIFTQHQITIINNHAAQKSVPASMQDLSFDNEMNVIAILNLLELVAQYPIELFIQASSGGALAKVIVGDERSKETDTPQFSSPYALTKFAGEQYLKIYSEVYNFDYLMLRYANVYGPRQVAAGDCGIVPIFVNNILERKASKLMTYADMPRGCTRDYVYVGDVAYFNQLLLETTDFKSGVYNIGSEHEYAMLDIYEMILAVFEVDVPIEVVGPRVGDLRRSVLDSTKLYETFGWKPQLSFLEGLEKVKEFYL